jgi:DNA primase
MDALKMWGGDYPYTVATLGAHVTEAQRFLLKQKGFTRVMLLRDGDEAGRKSAIKDAQRLQSPTINVAIANLPDGTDPASASLSDIRTALKEAKPVELNLGTESMTEVHHGP